MLEENEPYTKAYLLQTVDVERERLSTGKKLVEELLNHDFGCTCFVCNNNRNDLRCWLMDIVPVKTHKG